MRKAWFLVLTLLVWAFPAAAQFVAPGGTIPAVANIPGENNTFWRSDVSILNLSPSDTSIVLLLLPELKNSGPAFEPQSTDPMPIVGGGQLTLRNVVTSVFGLRNKKGGLAVFSTDGAPLVLASRTFTNAAAGGSFGLNVTGVLAADTAWVAGVEHDGFFRTNVGVFLPVDPQPGQPLIFTVTTLDAAGLEVASGSVTFDRAGLKQDNLDAFGVDGALLDGSLTIHCNDPAAIWYAYATVIDNQSGDSVYRAAIPSQSSLP